VHYPEAATTAAAKTAAAAAKATAAATEEGRLQGIQLAPQTNVWRSRIASHFSI
jgi:hypothetical protein